MAMENVPVAKLFKHFVDLDGEQMQHALLHLALAETSGDPTSFAVTSDGPTGRRLWLSISSQVKLLDALNKEKV